MNTNHQNDVLLREFREKLEAVLDEHFPKIEEEGEAKRLNKRGQALMIYSEAVTLARTAFDKVRAGEREEGRKEAVEYIKAHAVVIPDEIRRTEKNGIKVIVESPKTYMLGDKILLEALSPPSGGTK